MNDLLQIKWGSGQMTVCMGVFFPCPIEQLKKLLKVIRLDWENEDDLILQLKQFFEDKADECESMFKIEGKHYWDDRQKVAELQERITSRKMPNGLPISRTDLKKYQKDLKQTKGQAEKAKKNALDNQKLKEKYEKLLEIIEKGSDFPCFSKVL